MAKNTLPTPAQMSERSDISAQTSMTPAERTLALRLNVDVTAPIDDLVAVGVEKTNRALRLIVEAGLNFLAVRERSPHGEFLDILESAGIDRRRAHEAMVLARGLAAMPMDHADKLLSMSKSKALLLAGVDSTVMEALVDDESIDIDLMSVRALRERIRDLEAATTDLTVQRDKAEANLEAVVRKSPPAERTDGVPMVVADLRSEIVALGKKAELSIESFGPVGSDLANLLGTDDASGWTDATTRLAISALSSLRLQLDGQIQRWLTLLPTEERRLLSDPPATAYLSREEIVHAASLWPRLTAAHEHEKALRDWERDQAKPRGKGRPAARPEAQKA